MIDPAYVAGACVLLVVVAGLALAWWTAERLSG